MPSRAYTSFLRINEAVVVLYICLCQCPLGLIPHFYRMYTGESTIDTIVSMPSRAYTSFLLFTWCEYFVVHPCQCPLGLIPHFYILTILQVRFVWISVNALSGLYLISTVSLQKPRFYAVSRACFCRYLSEYSDNSCFSCMLTFWTYLMRCTYP